MQKGNTSSKKVSASSHMQVEQYKSEVSKSTVNAIRQQKQSYAFQNMKEFKCQIDHQIAKCLDTLDRQGLKFLKETLRASKIFGLNTQQLGITQPVEENISVEQQPVLKHKEKQIPKKIQSLKHNVQIKKVSKPELTKKTQSAQANQVKNTKQVQTLKNDLNEKINKRLDSLNIKTGKKNEQAKKSQPDSKVKKEPNIEIAEQIQIEEPEVKEQRQQPIKQIIYHHSSQPNVNTISYQSNKSVKNYQVQPKIQEQNLPSKPFHRKTFKKITQDLKPQRQSKDYAMEVSHEDNLTKSIDQSIKKEQNIPITQPEQPKQLILPIQSKQALIEPSNNSSEASVDRRPQISSDPYMSNLIAVISRLSPTKRNKLQRIIQKLQYSDKYSNTQSLVSDLSKNQIYHKPYVPQKQPFPKQPQFKDNHSKSRSKIEKVEKATSLKGSFIKKIGNSQATQNHLSLDNRNIQQKTKQETKNDKSKNVLERYDDSNSQMIQEKKQSKLQSSIISQSKEHSKNIEANLQINKSHLFQSNLFGQNESGQKLIKISKRKNQITNITFKILSNNGHNSSVGLNSIQILNSHGQLISIDESNLKQSNSKILKLFTQNLKGQGWLTSLSNPTISIQNITQQVGGIRIINWNKSQLEVDRQTDMMEIWINDQLHWRGQIKGGSYKEKEVYATNIKVMEKHFQFPQIKQELSKSIIKEEKSPKIISSTFKNKTNIQQPQIKETSLCWLEKDSVQKKLKEIQEQERKDEKVKKIGTLRNTYALNQQEKSNQSPVKQQHKAFQFGLSWLNQQDPKQKKDEFKFEKQQKSNLRSHANDDILHQLSRGLDTKKKKDEASLPIIINKKDESSLLSIGKRDQTLSINRKRQQPSLKIKQAKKQYLMQKEKEQDQQFQKILQSMEERNKQKQTYKPQNKSNQANKDTTQNKGKMIAQKNFQDFMNDSLFSDKPALRKFQNKPATRPLKIVEEKQAQDYNNIKQSKNVNNKELDNLIDELNDVVAGQNNEETGEQFYIPQLPKGKQINIVILSNWGNQHFVGLNGIELFDSDGEQVKPIGVACSLINSKQLYQKLFKQELLTSDEKIQVKFPKNKKIAISLTLSQRTQLAGIRLWNYNGHRVHNNIGVKKLHIKFDNNFIFSGQIQQSLGPSENAYKYCEHILFTDNNNIINKINQNDWLNRINRKEEQERILFKTTLENFHRPITRNDQQAVKKQIQEIEIQKQPIKLPKRQCFQYDPPILPQGFVLKFVLHNSWGDRFFIGLNGIEIFNEKGQNFTNKNLTQIRADPSSISKLQGYQRDKRVVTNLINGKNNTVTDSNIWLAPLLSDVERIDRGKPNIILMEYSKANKIAGINFYNYIKTPQRGVRQVQIFLDNFLLYRGYLKKYNSTQGLIHTTINFTKQQNLLEMMNYAGYNEDHLEQQVALINQQKIIKANVNAFQVNLTRPMTGKILL